MDSNLRRSVEDRPLRHYAVLELALELRRAGQAYYAQLHLVLQRLSDAGVEFVVVGGYAAVIQRSAYVTDDVDVCAGLSPDTVEKIRIALAELKPVHRRLSFLDHPPHGQSLKNLYLETEGGIVDILSSVLGVGDFHRLRERAVVVTVFGRQVPVISVEDLIVAKEGVGRDKDKLTATKLRAIIAMRAQKNDEAS